jgi:hypothetical protein
MAVLGEQKAAAAGKARSLGQKRRELLGQRAEAAQTVKELEAKQVRLPRGGGKLRVLWRLRRLGAVAAGVVHDVGVWYTI